MALRIFQSGRLSVSVFFKAVDVWVGLYLDVKGRAVYVCPVPMLGVKVSW